MTLDAGLHSEAALLETHELAASRQVADQRGEPHRHPLEELRGDGRVAVLDRGHGGYPDDVDRRQIAGKVRGRDTAEELHAVVEAGGQTGSHLGLESRVGEGAAEVQHGFAGFEQLHDVEHQAAAAAAREAADVDELEARVGGEIGHRLGAREALDSRVVGQHEAKLRRAAQCHQLILGDDDDAGAQARQAPLGDAGDLRSDGTCALGDVVLRGDGLRHVLVHVVHESRDEGTKGGEQGEQLGVVDVHDIRAQRAQRAGDLDAVKKARAAPSLR